MRTQLAIVGGGPAGMMLGLLMARAGIDVVVLEKHGDFLRDFRGDTVHPSTLEVIYELGLLDEFLKRPHQRIARDVRRDRRRRASRSPISAACPAHCQFIALMPQWDFLDFLSLPRQALPEFPPHHGGGSDRSHRGGRPHRRRRRRYARRAGWNCAPISSSAATAVTRWCASRPGFRCIEFGVPIDVLWMKLSKDPNDSPTTLGRMAAGLHLRHARSRRLLAMRARHFQRRRRKRLRAEGSRCVPPGDPEGGAAVRQSRRRDSRLGSGEASHRQGEPPARMVQARASCASAMPRMPCRRSAASASISPSRTRSRPRIFSRRCLRAARLRSTTSSACSSAANFPPR